MLSLQPHKHELWAESCYRLAPGMWKGALLSPWNGIICGDVAVALADAKNAGTDCSESEDIIPGHGSPRIPRSTSSSLTLPHSPSLSLASLSPLQRLLWTEAHLVTGTRSPPERWTVNWVELTHNPLSNRFHLWIPTNLRHGINPLAALLATLSALECTLGQRTFCFAFFCLSRPQRLQLILSWHRMQ